MRLDPGGAVSAGDRAGRDTLVPAHAAGARIRGVGGSVSQGAAGQLSDLPVAVGARPAALEFVAQGLGCRCRNRACAAC